MKLKEIRTYVNISRRSRIPMILTSNQWIKRQVHEYKVDFTVSRPHRGWVSEEDSEWMTGIPGTWSKSRCLLWHHPSAHCKVFDDWITWRGIPQFKQTYAFLCDLIDLKYPNIPKRIRLNSVTVKHYLGMTGTRYMILLGSGIPMIDGSRAPPHVVGGLLCVDSCGTYICIFPSHYTNFKESLNINKHSYKVYFMATTTISLTKTICGPDLYVHQSGRPGIMVWRHMLRRQRRPMVAMPWLVWFWVSSPMVWLATFSLE